MPTDLNAILARMADLGSTHVDKTLTVQIYGKPGVGKTVLAIGLAKYVASGKRVIYIDTREGWVSLDNHPALKAGVVRLQLKDFGDFGGVAQMISNGTLSDVGAVVIDEVTTASDMLLDELFRKETGQTDPSEIAMGKPDWSLYRPVGDALVRVITLFQQLKVHLIMVSHEREVKDHRDVLIVRPGLNPSANDRVQRLLHVSARLTSVAGAEGRVTRELQSHPTFLVDAKSRIGGLPVKTDAATFVQVIHDWVTSTNATLVAEAAPIDADPLPSENGIGPAGEHVGEEPVMGEM